MKDYKKLLDSIAEKPFHPLYNLGDKTYSIVSEGSYLSIREGGLKERVISDLDLPLIFEITEEDYNSLTKMASESPLSNLESFKRVDDRESLFLSYLVSRLLEPTKDCWWIDSLLSELGEGFDLQFLLSLQASYRELLYELNPSLKTYIPYHWTELALLSVAVIGEKMGELQNINLSEDLDKELQDIINEEFKQLKESIRSKKLSHKHKENIMKYLILTHNKDLLEFGMPFPFDTKGKKVERVSIKIVKVPKQELPEEF